MNKIIFCALIIAGFCFGQGIKSAFDADVSLMLSRSIYMKPMKQINNLPPNEMAFNTAHNISVLNAYTLIMQVEGESLQPKTSFWKQSGIYGLEFVGAGVGATTCFCVLWLFKEPEQMTNALAFNLIGNMLLTSSGTWITAKSLKQRGSWWKSAIGSGVGWVLGISILTIGQENPFAGLSAYILAPSFGAIIGFNM